LCVGLRLLFSIFFIILVFNAFVKVHLRLASLERVSKFEVKHRNLLFGQKAVIRFGSSYLEHLDTIYEIKHLSFFLHFILNLTLVCTVLKHESTGIHVARMLLA
jgi:hypothetical protein